MGPMSPAISDASLRAALEPVAAETASFTVTLQPPMRFMQSTVVVMTIDPNGPIRALHERIKSAGLSYEAPRFTFTPHVTLSFYPELPRDRLAELLRVRIDDVVTVDSIQAYRAVSLTRTQKVLDLPLGGAAFPLAPQPSR
jgi:2'-5' RNA ligase